VPEFMPPPLETGAAEYPSSSPELQASSIEIPNIEKTTGAQAVFKKSLLLFSIAY
jgi:hypothetical protein